MKWISASRRAYSATTRNAVPAFTPEQTEWPRLMKDHITVAAASADQILIKRRTCRQRGLQKAWGLFGKELDGLINQMNEELVA
ncbi:MAG: hypothetical protein IPK19_28505 [Chloroflexi bacterium]|nr:hypothetical protein [Chloroflexota bacterium]